MLPRVCFATFSLAMKNGFTGFAAWFRRLPETGRAPAPPGASGETLSGDGLRRVGNFVTLA